MRFRLFILLFLVFPFVTGWGHWGPKVKIGLSLDHSQSREAFLRKLQEAMEDNRAELLVRDAKGNQATQEDQVKDLIKQGIQALVVMPCDPAKAEPLVKAAHQAGIKVISLNQLIPNSDLDYLVGFNAEKAGQLQAEAMVKKVPKGRYILLEADPNETFSKDFRDGQMMAFQPLMDRGEITASREGSQAHGVSKEMKALLVDGKNKVDAILAWDNKGAEEAINVLEKVGFKVPVGGQGEDLAVCRRILSGTQTMTIYHPPQKLAEETAYLAAKLARKAAQFDCQFVDLDNGKTKAVLLTPAVVTAQNLDNTVIHDGVQTKEAVYGK